MTKALVQFRFVFITIAFSAIGCGSSETSSSDDKDLCGKPTQEQTAVKICSFVSTPTASESITLKNYGTSSVILTGYTLWDKNANTNGSGQKTLSASDVISAGSTLTIATGGTPFVINDTEEVIYLKDSSGALLDSKTN